MRATEILSEEHRVILRVVHALGLAAERLQSGEPVRPGFFLDAADFIKYFADGCHHRKEEGSLFVALGKAGLPAGGGPVGVMLAEHEEGRSLTRSLREAAERYAKGDASAREAVARSALGYATLLQEHIFKEDRVLFPMADRALSPEAREALDGDFERLGRDCAGANEKYRLLADALAKEMESGNKTGAAGI